MPMLNPYDSQEVSNEFPLLLAILFGLGLILLVASIYLLYIRKKDKESQQKVPEWAINSAYPAFFLLLPFVLVVTAMLFLPKSWFGAELPEKKETSTEEVIQSVPKRFLNPDSLANIGREDTISLDSAPANRRP